MLPTSDIVPEFPLLSHPHVCCSGRSLANLGCWRFHTACTSSWMLVGQGCSRCCWRPAGCKALGSPVLPGSDLSKNQHQHQHQHQHPQHRSIRILEAPPVERPGIAAGRRPEVSTVCAWVQSALCRDVGQRSVAGGLQLHRGLVLFTKVTCFQIIDSMTL